MAGVIIPILERTDYSFSNLAALSSTDDIPVAQNVDISQWPECTLLVRVHAYTLGGDGQKYFVRLRSVLPSAQDPNQFFRDESVYVAEIQLFDGIPVPTLLRAPVAAGAGAFVSVFVKAEQGDPVGDLDATLSVVLCAKE